MVTDATVTNPKAVWSPRLRRPLGPAGQLFYIAVVAGLVDALLVIAGLTPRWALALSWALGVVFLAVRAAIATKRWPTAHGWVKVALVAALAFGVAAAVSH